MQRFAHYFFVLTGVLLVCVITLAFYYSMPIDTQADSSALPTLPTNRPNNQNIIGGEILLSETENAYNPIPSPDGSLIAYVRTGWGRHEGINGLGRSNLVSEVALMNANGNVLTKQPLADAFLQGWSSDGKYLICSRDGEYSIISPDGKVLMSEHLPERSDSYDVSERVAFLSNTNTVIWLQNYYTNIKRTQTSPASEYMTRDLVRSVIQSPKEEIAKYSSQFSVDAILISSPNEKYLALIGGNYLQVYDRQKASWTNLGKIIIHPADNWDYIKPTWNPWFADSSRLVFMTASGIVVSSPDGKLKQKILNPKQPSGLTVPSPDGNFIAFATFEPRPMKIREDLNFWGGSTIWVVPVAENSRARAITQKNQDTTLSLRWLNNKALVFDRIADELFYRKARLWKADVSQ
jgi:hypothetical protein